MLYSGPPGGKAVWGTLTEGVVSVSPSEEEGKRHVAGHTHALILPVSLFLQITTNQPPPETEGSSGARETLVEGKRGEGWNGYLFFSLWSLIHPAYVEHFLCF